MKQQIITGLKKKILLAELPGSTENNLISINHDSIDNEKVSRLFLNSGYVLSFQFWVNTVGKLTDVTESQCKELVGNNYPHYCFNEGKFKIKCKTAQESFFSKLEVDGICFSNPLGDFPTKHNTGLEYGMEYISKQASW